MSCWSCSPWPGARTPKPAGSVTVRTAAPPAEPKKPQLEATPVAPTDANATAQLDAAPHSATVYFAFDRDDLEQDGLGALQRVADVLRKHPQLKVRIEGNCDERGTEECNLALGHRRAAAAAEYLHDLGVSDAQLDTISYGAMRPAVQGHDETAWGRNRRDEVKRASN